MDVLSLGSFWQWQKGGSEGANSAGACIGGLTLTYSTTTLKWRKPLCR